LDVTPKSKIIPVAIVPQCFAFTWHTTQQGTSTRSQMLCVP